MASSCSSIFRVTLPPRAARSRSRPAIASSPRIGAAWGISMSRASSSSAAPPGPTWPQLGALSTRTGQYWIIRNNIVRHTTGKGIDCGSETWDPESLIATEPEDKHVLIGGHHLVEGNLVTDNAQCGIAAWNTDFVRIIGNIVRDNCASAARQRALVSRFRGRRHQSPRLPQRPDRGQPRRQQLLFRHLAGQRLGERPRHPQCLHRQSRRRHLRRTGLRTDPRRSQSLGRQRAAGPSLFRRRHLYPRCLRRHDHAQHVPGQCPLWRGTDRRERARLLAQAHGRSLHETITGNLFYGNRDRRHLRCRSLSPRSHDNRLGLQRHRAQRELRHQQQRRPHPR